MPRRPVADDDPIGQRIADSAITVSETLAEEMMHRLFERGEIASMPSLIHTAYVSGLSLGARIAISDIVAARKLSRWIDDHIADEDVPEPDPEIEPWLRVLR